MKISFSKFNLFLRMLNLKHAQTHCLAALSFYACMQ